jgi:tetratricopeptide (TPR) repeat protein
LAIAGDAKGAEKAADKLNKKWPVDTVVQRYLLPMSRAAIALANMKADRAVELLSEMTPYELSGGYGWQSGLNLDQVYIHGLAFLMQRNGSAAVAEFQKIIDHPGIVQEDAIGALAHLQLGRAYVLQGDTARARAAYQDFLALWKDGDPEIPILQQAKAEYARLR